MATRWNSFVYGRDPRVAMSGLSNDLTSVEDFERFLAQFTNYERQRTYRYDKQTFGLARIEALVHELGHPERAFPSIHIAGTKGKGSTSLILEALLLERAFRVGTYTSPHVEELRERIRLWGKPIATEDLVAVTREILPALDRIRTTAPEVFPSFFELMTAVAFESFRRWNVDLGILEVGLGGRLDATNVVIPHYTAITSIDFEHTQQLGSTLRAIATEKAGIVKTGVVLFFGPLPEEAEAAVREVAASREAPVVPVTADEVCGVGQGEVWLEALGARIVAPSIIGPGLRIDLALALRVAARILADAGKPTLTATEVERAMAELQLPARMERFEGNPLVVIDAAHTAESLGALKTALSEEGQMGPRTVILSLSHGKDIARLFEELREVGTEVLLTRADTQRSLAPAELHALLGYGTVIDDPAVAFETAVAAGHPVVITGSFYLAGCLRPLAREHAARTATANPDHRDKPALVKE